MTIRTAARLLLIAAAALCVARPALAGPPLLCFPFEIGAAQSLPVGTAGWESTDPRYDASHVVEDTLALLTPGTPVIVRMETLRRATLYASRNRDRGVALLDALKQRAAVPDANAPLAVFDFGYLVETYKQATHLFGSPMQAAHAIDGYSLVAKASAMRGDPQMEFALAVMTRDRTKGADVYRAHLANVVKAAPSDPAIEANLGRQFGSDLR